MGTDDAILIVEDDHDIREAIKELLEDAGYRVVLAAHGEDALGQMRSGLNPRLILFDLMMPVMDGITFREQQRADPRFSAIPVVLTSADRLGAERVKAMGVAGWLVKPFLAADLLAAVERLLAPG